MTPAARIAAAIACLDPILGGAPAEKVLTNWARRNRFAGSSDRAAIRDLVFDALRQRRSFGWLGGGETGRALMIGALRARGEAPEAFFTGDRYAPSSLDPSEASVPHPLSKAPTSLQMDCPEWLWPRMVESLGDTAEPVFSLMKSRAPVVVRVNRTKTDVSSAIAALQQDGIATRPISLSPTALEVTENPRRLQQAQAFLDGLVELQDAASQAVVDCLFPWAEGRSVLDYCAGGGGKSLALAAGGADPVIAHDAIPERMRDIPQRAARAGTPIRVATQPNGSFDLVLCDAPCSGTGAWRRQPDAKWRLTPGRLAELTALQDTILDRARSFVGSRGRLAYATCSLLSCENEERAEAFLNRHRDWTPLEQRRFSPLDGGDGFFLAVFECL